MRKEVESFKDAADKRVEVATGDVLKCDGWKRPAKGARGSIYSATFEGYGVTVHGPKYAR